MTEFERVKRNRDMLQETNVVFRAALARVMARLQADGFRPRIQQAWRSPADQLAAFASGHSKLQWGYHNATTPDGKPDALAVDMLDDDHPLNPAREYLLALVRAARAEGLDTGIEWGLPMTIRKALRAAIAFGTPWEKAIGWDPTHVEVTGLSVQQARNGARPSASGTANT